jgi:hypothetical protein
MGCRLSLLMMTFIRLTETAQAVANELCDVGHFERALDLFRPLLRPEILREILEAELAALLAHQPPPTKNAPGGQLHIVSQPGVDLRARLCAEPNARVRELARLARESILR